MVAKREKDGIPINNCCEIYNAVVVDKLSIICLAAEARPRLDRPVMSPEQLSIRYVGVEIQIVFNRQTIGLYLLDI